MAKTATNASAYFLSHPTRLVIIRLLLAKPLTQEQIRKELPDVPEYLVNFHLDTLEEHGFVSTTWGRGNTTAPIRAVPQYSLTAKVREALQDISKGFD
jgi:DNA-binding PadR family transcriptional regulator